MRNLVEKILHYVRLFEQTPHTFVIAMAIAIGILCGLGAAGFRYLTFFFQHLFYGNYSDYLIRISEIPWYYKVAIPCLGGLLIAPIIRFFPNIKGHGVPEVMESVAVKGGRLPPWTFLLKAVASALCIGSGGSVGQEGPIVMIGSSIGSNVGQAFRVSRHRMRTFVACGAAGGIAATFNAPIAGVIFAVEIIMGEFAVEHFTPIVFSSVIATSISHWLVGDMPSFIVPAYELKSAFELVNYFLLGVVCAVIAVTYTNFLYKTEDFFERSLDSPVPETRTRWTLYRDVSPGVSRGIRCRLRNGILAAVRSAVHRFCAFCAYLRQNCGNVAIARIGRFGRDLLAIPGDRGNNRRSAWISFPVSLSRT